MKNLITRTITGAIFVSLIAGSALWDPYTFAGLFLVVTLGCVYEFYRLFGQQQFKPQQLTGMIISGVVYLVLIAIARDVIKANFITLLLPIILFPFVAELYRKHEQPFINIALTLLPVLYIALPLASLSFLFNDPRTVGLTSPYIVLGFFILVWTGDTMAYLGGWTLGRHRLFERISPKKSWEGSIIGGLFALGMAWFLSIFFTELSTFQWLGMALILIVAGTFGDLVESLLKRSVDVKDSGTIMPGHGGFLDRFDSAFLGAPCVFMYINLITSLQ